MQRARHSIPSPAEPECPLRACPCSGRDPKQHSGTKVQLLQTAGACAGESSPGKLCLPSSVTSDALSAHSSWGTLPEAPQGLAPSRAPLLWVGTIPSAAPCFLVQKSAEAFGRKTFKTQFPGHDVASRRRLSGVLTGIDHSESGTPCPESKHSHCFQGKKPKSNTRNSALLVTQCLSLQRLGRARFPPFPSCPQDSHSTLCSEVQTHLPGKGSQHW